MGNDILTLRDISKYYISGRSVVMGLNKINLTFRIGEFVAITGESGSGKSTLAKVMAGIIPYENGEMYLSGRPTSHYDGADWERYRSDSISFISQSYDILPGCTVLRNVVSALRLTGVEAEEAFERAEEILREVELWDMRKRKAAKLSSGQMQRLSIARALAKPAPILIADEPTGNLDPENSAKIIELLSAAAKDRLVIMITHEFDEAVDYATRHITLQDSVIASDVPLRPRHTAEAEAPRRRTLPRGLSLYTAALQMIARPVWSSIMLLFFTLTAFAAFAFLGTFVGNLDDTFTRIYDDDAFRNGAKERIVVVRSDGTSMTEEEMLTMLGIEYVESVETMGLVSDVNYYYRQGTDYVLRYNAIGNSFDQDATELVITPVLVSRELFVETIPLLPDGETFLTGGRLPENMFEVVAGDESLLGQTIPVYVQNTKMWQTDYVALEVTIVGTTDHGPHLYFSEQMGRSLSHAALHNDLFVIPGYGLELDGMFLSSERYYAQLADYASRNRLVTGTVAKWTDRIVDGRFAFFCYGAHSTPLPLQLSEEFHQHKLFNAIVVSPETYEAIVEDVCNVQVCLSISDYAYTDKVLNELTKLGYGALSPYRLGSTTIDETLAEERMQTLKVCLLALVAVVLLQIVVLRAMFSMEMNEYRILSNLGLRCKTAKRSILWQILGFALSGEALTAAITALCSAGRIERIVRLLRYLPAPYLLAIWAVHLATSILTALWISHALRRQVYPVAGIRSDLSMDEEVEA